MLFTRKRTLDHAQNFPEMDPPICLLVNLGPTSLGQFTYCKLQPINSPLSPAGPWPSAFPAPSFITIRLHCADLTVLYNSNQVIGFPERLRD